MGSVALEGQVVAARKPPHGRTVAQHEAWLARNRRQTREQERKIKAALSGPPATFPRYTLDGVPLDLADFIEVNELEAEQVAAIHNLQPGETMNFGGGASATFVLRREGGGA